ncbi:hypothetical protein GCM10023194_21380 [Planotetraspora phitsanulokensis]|uniref:FAD-binding PCMH-type domain-containing protein n=1 Tax=Planotetraspora phitsanulokensis TaxID=575192 RepID=A0A8J3XFH2_9ACTN|nr:LLM class flavin-dependent oxidoreductase [Planotetraspora phitsanulokensis]GII38196.1 hypothetical protein Pph01_31990 [Planotetraspora phitsanulokensis]
MPDYGQPIRFGTFVTPVNDPASHPVQLAVVSEQLGYDLVTFQDHPYQSDFHDTWTLMSWVAAKTERIALSGNVLNLTLRPPAVLARAAASLDLLSEGRLTLGVGAGGFADAAAAMGAPKRTPGEGMQALGEAIEIIRGIWAARERGPLRVHGRFHQVDGVRRGPAPFHDIPIWVGAYKPRMLSLTGRLADGWMPTLYGFTEPGSLEAAVESVDAAARQAGRDPGDITRVLNIRGRFSPDARGQLDGPPKLWVEQLTELAIEHGFSTFVLMSDEPGELQRFAEDVAPGVREAVAAARPATSQPRSRGGAVLAKRHSGIDYDAVPATLAARAIEPGDREYARVRSTYLRGGSPGLVLSVTNATEVAEAIGFARTQSVPLATRSAGHGISGRSTNDGGIVIDLSAMRGVEVLDPKAGTVRVQPGARWIEVAQALAPYGLAISSGDYGGTGVGGLATAGGVGYLSRAHGLTIDHLTGVDIVTADGTLVRADETENPDLFWAVRGAGANFGIVTSFDFRADRLGRVGDAQLVFDASETAKFLVAWGQASEGAPRDTTGFLNFGQAHGGQQLARARIVVDSEDPDVILERLAPFLEAGPLLGHEVVITTYSEILSAAPREQASTSSGEPNVRSGMLSTITPEFATAVGDFLAGGQGFLLQFRAVGGAVSDVPGDATAFAHRDANYAVACFGMPGPGLDRAWDELRPYFSGLYLSFETGPVDQRLHDAFPPETLTRLREVKSTWDPENVFRDNFNVWADRP